MKKKNKQFSLKQKLTLWIVSVILVFGIMATYFVYVFSRNSLLSDQKMNLEEVAIERTHETAEIFENGRAIAETISRQKEIVAYLLENGKYSYDDVLKILERYNIGDNYSAIYLMNALGDTIVSTDKSFEGNNYAFRDSFSKAFGGTPWIDAILSDANGQLGYCISHSIKTESGEILGVIVTKMRPEKINHSIHLASYIEEDMSMDMERETEMMLIDEYGIVMYANMPERLYKSIGQFTQEQIKEIELKKRFSDIEILPLQYKNIQEELFEIENSEIFDFYNEENGEREIVSVTKIDNTPFYIFEEIGIERIMQRSYTVALYLGLFVLLAAFSAAVIIFLLLSKVLIPLTQLKEAVAEISNGRLDYEIKIKSHDEIGELSQDFILMREKLKASITDIENKVEERTRQLKKINEHMIGREIKMTELKKKIKELEKNNEK